MSTCEGTQPAVPAKVGKQYFQVPTNYVYYSQGLRAHYHSSNTFIVEHLSLRTTNINLKIQLSLNISAIVHIKEWKQ